MGTRSLTRFITQHDDEKITITTIYRQYDGYPQGHGKELADFLMSGEMCNGFGVSEKRLFNGLGCLAAQFIADFKQGVGNVYIHHPDSKDCGEEYIYDVIYKYPKGIGGKPNEDSLIMSCYDVYKKQTIFEGNPKDFHTILQTA
jgi:hypothetical protein